MALPASGIISLADIQTEFGGTNPVGLGEYYKGGAYVTTNDNAPNIPASGAISVSNFYSASKFLAGVGPSSDYQYVSWDSTLPPAQRHGTCTSVNFTCTPTGGVGPYTYQWFYNSGDSFTMVGDTTATVYFTETYSGPGIFYITHIGYYYCQVTDSRSATANSNLITIQFDFEAF